ncbi:EamA family transporter RarD [bacterium]|nr:EamA family transporter RarD [bacterium]
MYALFAYVFWGLHPVYWKQLHHINALEIVSHRIFWSLVFFIIVISFHRGWKPMLHKIRECSNKWIIFIPALLIGSNWGTYIWAVNAGYIIETSLGYFISPLLTVFLAVLFLHENLRKVQWAAVIIAAGGVLYMTFVYGQFPWISLFLAGTWGAYGLLRKKSPLNSMEGLTVETCVLAVPAVMTLMFISGTGETFFTRPANTLLLMGSGLISGVPLLVFISGARMIPLSLIGILQYIYPTLIFLIGAFVYHEPLSPTKLTGFYFIWIALSVYTIEGIAARKRPRRLK